MVGAIAINMDLAREARCHALPKTGFELRTVWLNQMSLTTYFDQSEEVASFGEISLVQNG